MTVCHFFLCANHNIYHNCNNMFSALIIRTPGSNDYIVMLLDMSVDLKKSIIDCNASQIFPSELASLTQNLMTLKLQQ